MGIDLRKVPPGWEHPKDANGYYIPLFDNFSNELSAWEEGKQQWNNGFKLGLSYPEKKWEAKEEEESKMTFEEWGGPKPERKEFVPEWKEEELTHIQLYETVTEGTPMSPVFKAEELEKLCEWLASNIISTPLIGTKYEWINRLETLQDTRHSFRKNALKKFETEIEHDGDTYQMLVEYRYNDDAGLPRSKYDLTVQLNKVVGEEFYPAGAIDLIYIAKERQYILTSDEAFTEKLYTEVIAALNDNYGDGWACSSN